METLSSVSTETKTNVKALAATAAAAAFMASAIGFGFAFSFQDGELRGDAGFMEESSGKIFLQVEDNGEAWYVSPNREDKRYFLCREDDAFGIMRDHGVGITNADLAKIPISENSAPTIGGVDPQAQRRAHGTITGASPR